MKKLVLMGLAISLVIGLILSGCSQPAPSPTPAPKTTPTPAPAPKQDLITWRYNGTMPPEHSATIGAQKFVKLVNERAAGKIKFDYFPTAQLYSANDLPNVLPSGGIQMSECPPNSLNGIVPATAILELPFLNPTVEGQAALLAKGKDIMDKELMKKNMKLIFFIDGGTISGPITRTKAVRTLEDWKGLRIRGTGGVMSKMIAAFGAGPVAMSGGEVYGALEKGTVDGAVGGYATMYERKWYEQCKFFPDYVMQYSFFAQVANLEAWNKLPPDVQKIMLDTGDEIFKGPSTAAKEITDTKAVLLKAGLEAIALPPAEMARWKAVSESLWSDMGKGDAAFLELLKMATAK
jgi:TRAP-type C4-dicarboxylate transport system substrate-binding protein